MVENRIDRVEELLSSFARTTDQLFSLEELRTGLLSGRKLRMKFGADVTAPTLHIELRVST